MLRGEFRLYLGIAAILAGIVGIALGGVQVVADQQVDHLFDQESNGASFQSLLYLILGGSGLIGGILLLATFKRPF